MTDANRSLSDDALLLIARHCSPRTRQLLSAVVVKPSTSEWVERLVREMNHPLRLRFQATPMFLRFSYTLTVVLSGVHSVEICIFRVGALASERKLLTKAISTRTKCEVNNDTLIEYDITTYPRESKLFEIEIRPHGPCLVNPRRRRGFWLKGVSLYCSNIYTPKKVYGTFGEIGWFEEPMICLAKHESKISTNFALDLWNAIYRPKSRRQKRRIREKERVVRAGFTWDTVRGLQSDIWQPLWVALWLVLSVIVGVVCIWFT